MPAPCRLTHSRPWETPAEKIDPIVRAIRKPGRSLKAGSSDRRPAVGNLAPPPDPTGPSSRRHWVVAKSASRTRPLRRGEIARGKAWRALRPHDVARVELQIPPERGFSTSADRSFVVDASPRRRSALQSPSSSRAEPAVSRPSSKRRFAVPDQGPVPGMLPRCPHSMPVGSRRSFPADTADAHGSRVVRAITGTMSLSMNRRGKDRIARHGCRPM